MFKTRILFFSLELVRPISKGFGREEMTTSLIFNLNEKNTQQLRNNAHVNLLQLKQ